MDPGFDVVFFASKEWRSHRQRPHWIAMELAARGANVLFVENLGTRLPRTRDLPRLATKVRQWARSSIPPRGEDVVPGIRLDAPLVVPLQQVAALRRASAVLLTRRLRRRVSLLETGRPLVVWTYIAMPVIRDAASALGADLLVYDWVDDNAAHSLTRSAAHRRRIAQWEDAMASAADLVFVASAELLRRRSSAKAKTFVIGHGAPRFDRADGGAPGALAKLPRPRVGFVGSISEFTDLGLIESLARARPSWSFVMVGPARVSLKALRALPNVTITGPRSHDDVMGILSSFDAAIVPYRMSPAIEVASPVKVHEYLACGLPVVSVDVPEVRALGSKVAIASGTDEFLSALDTAVARGRRVRPEGGPHPPSWAERVDVMVAHVEEALAGRALGDAS